MEEPRSYSSKARVRNSSTPSSLIAPISPPPIKAELTRRTDRRAREEISADPKQSAVEAGQAKVENHLAYFSRHLQTLQLPSFLGPRLSISALQDLYARNKGPHGHHFVIHQHDHPIAGTHYDLRLQINETSSASWAIMYGLPGNPASRRSNRSATETRIHCLWVSQVCVVQEPYVRPRESGPRSPGSARGSLQ